MLGPDPTLPEEYQLPPSDCPVMFCKVKGGVLLVLCGWLWHQTWSCRLYRRYWRLAMHDGWQQY